MYACIYTHLNTCIASVITIVVILLFYFPSYSCLLFGSLHANVVGNEEKKAPKEQRREKGGEVGVVAEIETISVLVNNQKSSTLPFFVLFFGFCVCSCVCGVSVGGKGDWCCHVSDRY